MESTMTYTKKHLNFFRMAHIVFNLIPVGLQIVFIQEWEYRNKRKWTDVNSSDNCYDFYIMEHPALRTEDQQSLDTIKEGKMGDWDCGCFFFAILFSKSIGRSSIPLSRKVRCALDDLRKVRNCICHINVGKLSNNQFWKCTGRVMHAFTSLGLATNDIESIKMQKTFQTGEVDELKGKIAHCKTERAHYKTESARYKRERDESRTEQRRTERENKSLKEEINSRPLESFRRLSFQPPHDIITRSSEVEEIAKKMQELYESSNGTVTTIYLSGNTGSGKTQLARQVGEHFYSARSQETEGQLTCVATLNAESLQTLADSYIELAKRLGITGYETTEMEKLKTEKPEETLKQAIRRFLPKIAEFANWLIIADGVVDLQLVRSYLPQTGSYEWGHGQVLVTTQDSSTIPSNPTCTFHKSLSKGMQSDDAKELLRKVSQISNQDQAEKVAEVLDYQPLFLAVAAYYVRTTVSSGASPNFNWADYLNMLLKGKRKTTEKRLADESTAYPQTMTYSVEMAIKRAMESSEVIKKTFSFLSLCASESLPLEYVVRFAKDEMTDDNMIKTEVLKASLILSLSDDDGAPKQIKVHNIIHDILKTMKILDADSTQKCHCIATAINIFGSELGNQIESSKVPCGFVQLCKLASHSRTLCDVVCSNIPSPRGLLDDLFRLINPCIVASWVSHTAQACLIQSDILSKARSFSKFASKLLQDIKATSTVPNMTEAEVLVLHGETLQMLGKVEEAQVYLQEGLNMTKDIGEEHSKVAARAYDNMGQLHIKIGQHYAYDAKAFHEKALNIRIKIYGKQHVAVASSYKNLGDACIETRQFDRAMECFEKALPIYKKKYGETNHGDVAIIYECLGSIYFSVKQYNEAEKHFNEALIIERTIYGEDHFKPSITTHSLANVFQATGRCKGAKKLLEKVLNIERKIDGEGQISTYESLANVCIQIGQYNEARAFQNKILECLKRQLCDEENFGVALSNIKLGVIGFVTGQFDEAKKLLKEALKIQRKNFGEEDGDVAASYLILGGVYHFTGQYNEAKEFIEKAKTICRNPDHLW